MIIDICKWVIISLILILLLHHLFFFFKNTLTVPIVKDLVNEPSQLYQEIMKTAETSNNNTIKLSVNNNINTKEMKDELKDFFNEINQKKSNTFSHADNYSKNIYSEL
jgi:hypothetical protein